MKKITTFTLITGTIFIAFGIFFLVKPEIALKSMVLIAAALAVIKGIFDIFNYLFSRKKSNKPETSSLIFGLFILALGILLFFNTDFGILFTGFLFALWFAIESIMTLITLKYFRVKSSPAFYIILAFTIIALALSVLMFIRPFYSAMSFTILTGAYFLIQGIVLTIISINVRSWFSFK